MCCSWRRAWCRGAGGQLTAPPPCLACLLLSSCTTVMGTAGRCISAADASPARLRLHRRSTSSLAASEHHAHALPGPSGRACCRPCWPLLALPPTCEEVDLCALALHAQVVAELALEALGALPVAEELAHDGLGVHACSRGGSERQCGWWAGRDGWMCGCQAPGWLQGAAGGGCLGGRVGTGVQWMMLCDCWCRWD